MINSNNVIINPSKEMQYGYHLHSQKLPDYELQS